jgi:putative ABC transport system substrate-binding protein
MEQRAGSRIEHTTAPKILSCSEFCSVNMQSAIRNSEKSAILVGALFLALCSVAEAQQPKKVPRIGFLEGATVAESQGIEPFRQGLRDLGHIDGQNIIIEIRSMEGKLDRIPHIVDEFLRSKIDVMFTPVTAGASAFKNGAPTIPVVVVVSDPVESGLVASLARPGGNITGLSAFVELGGKRLELLKDTLPNLNRAAVFWTPGNVTLVAHFMEMEASAGVLGNKLYRFEIRGPEDFDAAFKAAVKDRVGALIAIRSPMLVNHRKDFLRQVGDHRLPAMYDDKNFVEPGGLMSYGTDRADLFRRAAGYVDKILKGAKPADLPVEQPSKFEFVINLKTAKQIGLTIPPNVLARADRVIR